MAELNSISKETRKPQVDLLRLVAVLLVLGFHFDKFLPWGFLGVDVFFVISGYLVSRPLFENYYSGKRIEWRTFLIKRAFKILPSYFFFLVVASVIVRIWVLPLYPQEAIPLEQYPEFIFFYTNYVGTLSWCFGHVWSLCIEEHFYLLLPLIFILTRFIKSKSGFNVLEISLIFIIVLTTCFRWYGYLNNADTYSATHMRLDALCYGVIISGLQIRQKLNWNRFLVSGIFILLLSGLFLFYHQSDPLLFKNFILHTIVPLMVGIALIFLLNVKFPDSRLLTSLAAKSYNWYLWHPLVAFILVEMTDFSVGVKWILYLLISYLVALITTRFVELPFLKLRTKFLQKTSA